MSKFIYHVTKTVILGYKPLTWTTMYVPPRWQKYAHQTSGNDTFTNGCFTSAHTFLIPKSCNQYGLSEIREIKSSTVMKTVHSKTTYKSLCTFTPYPKVEWKQCSTKLKQRCLVTRTVILWIILSPKSWSAQTNVQINFRNHSIQHTEHGNIPAWFVPDYPVSHRSSGPQLSQVVHFSGGSALCLLVRKLSKTWHHFGIPPSSVPVK